MFNVYKYLMCFLVLILCFPLINTNTAVIVYVLIKNMRIFFLCNTFIFENIVEKSLFK